VNIFLKPSFCLFWYKKSVVFFFVTNGFCMFAYHQKQKANAEGVLTETSKRERGTFLSTLFPDGYGKVEFKVGRILQAVYYFMFFF